MSTVQWQTDGAIAIVTIDRPEVRNAVDGRPPSARRGVPALRRRPGARGRRAHRRGRARFCAGADLKAVADGRRQPRDRRAATARWGRRGCCSPKPVIAAVEGYAVAGGLELALWCDLRVAARDAVFGVFCRRWGVPLIDGGTIRLPRLIGHSHALDLILTGRGVSGEEALRMGLANRLVDRGAALVEAVAAGAAAGGVSRSAACAATGSRPIASGISPLDEALAEETRLGFAVIQSGETAEGAGRFASGAGRHGKFE